MLEAFVELFRLFEDLFSREAALWISITGVLAIILEGLNATGKPDSYIKKTGKEKWTKFKF